MSWNVQVATWTSNNRYPGIFRTVQNRVASRLGQGLGGARLKLLSFGCSDGSEVSTLRSYFPEAAIYACDINAGALHSAAELLFMDEAVVFLSSPENIAEHGPFDVIFALSVLCRFPESMSPTITNLQHLYRFESFESTVELLAGNLKQRGMLCLYNTTYNFLQTSVASRFSVVRSPLVASNGFVDRFDSSGHRVTWCEKVGPYYVHRLHGNQGFEPAADFKGCIFEAGSGEADIWVPFGETSLPSEAAPPELMRFGPDLPCCASRNLVATALGYWFPEFGNDRLIVRAWHSTTPEGTVEQGVPWAVRSGSDVKATLAAHPGSRLPPAPLPTRSERAVGAVRSVKQHIYTRLTRHICSL